MGLSGDVELTLQVGADGKVKDVQVRSGNPVLAGAAAQSARLWRYEPSTLDGKPVASSVEVTVKFSNPR
jgi:protein TonB